MLDPADLYRAFDSPPDAVVRFLQFVSGATRQREFRSVLDIGCGPGRLLAPLQALNWTVHGIEPDPAYLAAACDLAEGNTGITVSAGHLLQLPQHRTFDLVVAINSVFPYLLSPESRRRALRAALDALHPTGCIVFDVPNYPWILDNYRPPMVAEATVGSCRIRRVRRHEWSAQQGRFDTTDTIYLLRTGGRAEVLETRTHIHAIVAPSDYLQDLKDTGFQSVACYRSFESRAPETPDGPRLILVATGARETRA